MAEQPSREGDKDHTDPVGEIARVLQGQAAKADRIERVLHDVAGSNRSDAEALDDLESRVAELRATAELRPDDDVLPTHLERPTPRVAPPTAHALTWDHLIAEYAAAMETTEVRLDDLLPPDVARDIEARFRGPLAREPWDTWDYDVVAAAAVLGVVADWFCAPLGNPLAEHLRQYGPSLHDEKGVEKAFRKAQEALRESELARRMPGLRALAEMRVDHDRLPIDYCGPNFGGQYHRALSGGHDLLRFTAAIWQIKNGQFLGVRYEHGRPILEVVAASHRGTAYAEKELGVAVVEYLLHITADFFTKTSIPVPGATILRELPNRTVRKFVVDMFEGRNPWAPEGERLSYRDLPEGGGYNLRHVVGQGVTPAVTTLVVWFYHLLRYRLKPWVDRHVRGAALRPPEAVPGLKYNEMLFAAHAAVAGVNIGKVAVAGNPLLFNLAEAATVGRYALGLALKTWKRYDLQARYDRNQVLLDEGWERIERLMAAPAPPGSLMWPQRPIILR